MGAMKDLLITVYGGGDDAVAAVERMGKDWREMLEQSASEVEGLQKKVPQWISVEERLPGTAWVMVLVWSQSNGMHLASVDSKNQWIDADGNDGKKITHWMPLPEPPQPA